MFRLRRPCAKCPFRSDVEPYVRPGRAVQIATSLAEGARFACHETTVPDEEGEGLAEGPGSQFCAGALLVMENGEEANQAMRMAERMSLYDPARMDREAPVYGSLAEFVVAHREDETEHECCAICNPGCLAPAGYMVGGSAIPAESEGVELAECADCGEPFCENEECGEDGRCSYCAEEVALLAPPRPRRMAPAVDIRDVC